MKWFLKCLFMCDHLVLSFLIVIRYYITPVNFPVFDTSFKPKSGLVKAHHPYNPIQVSLGKNL